MDDQTFIWAVKCLNGEIIQDMRMVTLLVEGTTVTFTYLLDREASNFVRERAEIVSLNFEAGLSYRPSRHDIEFIRSSEPRWRLIGGAMTLYIRWEDDEGGTTPDF